MSSSASSETLAQPRAATVVIDTARLRIGLVDGRELSVPLDWFVWLANAAEEQREDFSIIGGGAGIWWGQLDEGISVPLLLGLPDHP